MTHFVLHALTDDQRAHRRGVKVFWVQTQPNQFVAAADLWFSSLVFLCGFSFFGKSFVSPSVSSPLLL